MHNHSMTVNLYMTSGSLKSKKKVTNNLKIAEKYLKPSLTKAYLINRIFHIRTYNGAIIIHINLT